MKQGRPRLTITMRKDLLQEVDNIIDGAKIRNRSHAIEYLLGKTLNMGVKKAFILAGGYGVDMRPFTYEIPKTMIPVQGRPILEHIINQLRDAGIRNIVILIGHLGEKVIQHFGDGSQFGVSITYIDEKKPLGTGGSLKKGETYFKETFLLFYGDVLADIDIGEFVDFHKSHKNTASVALSTAVDVTEYGIVKLRGNKIVDFIEKPPKRKKLSGLVSAGVYLFEPEIFDYLPVKHKRFSLETEVFPKLIKVGKAQGYPFEGKWFDVATPKAYEHVIKYWKNDE